MLGFVAFKRGIAGAAGNWESKVCPKSYHIKQENLVNSKAVYVLGGGFRVSGYA